CRRGGRARARRRSDGAAPGGSGRRSRRRILVREKRCRRRRLVDEHRLHCARACARGGALHRDDPAPRGLPGSGPAVALLALLAPASAGASPARPVVALTASPTHLTLLGRDRRMIRVANPGATAIVVSVSAAGFTLGLRGRPHVAGGASARRVAS